MKRILRNSTLVDGTKRVYFGTEFTYNIISYTQSRLPLMVYNLSELKQDVEVDFARSPCCNLTL
jgi:hypothetical protein